MKKVTYRASDHVTLGKADQHAYNMFVSFFEQINRLGLCKQPYWIYIADAFERLT